MKNCLVVTGNPGNPPFYKWIKDLLPILHKVLQSELNTGRCQPLGMIPHSQDVLDCINHTDVSAVP